MMFTNARGGVVTILMAFLAAGSVAAVAVWSAGPSRPAPSLLPPREVAAVLVLAGISPESLAAAGVTVGECAAVFDRATVYGLGADRLDELRAAFAALNRARDQAVRPASRPGGEQPTIGQRRAAVDDLTAAAFEAATASLVPGQVEKLANIKANRDWQLPLPYLTVNRERAEWLRLRKALDAQKLAQRRGRELDPEHAQVLAAANQHPSVSSATSDLADRLDAIKQAWDARFR